MNKIITIFRNFEDQTDCLKKTDQIQAILTKRRWRHRIEQTVAARWNIKRKFDALYELADDAYAVVTPFSACTKLGCSHCCNIACEISSIEAERIGAVIKRKPINQPPFSLEILTLHKERRETLREPCTFLKDGRCSIYQHRPIACRIMHNVGSGAGCDLSIPSNLSNVPTFDFRPLINAMAQICMTNGVTLADIRDFFPARD